MNNMQQLTALSENELRDLFWIKRDEIYTGHGKFGMWDFSEIEREKRISEVEEISREVISRCVARHDATGAAALTNAQAGAPGRVLP
jgi:hypothetical protein